MEPLDFFKARRSGTNQSNIFLDKIPFQPRLDDVIIAGYTKSGTTWLQQIAHQIRTGGDDSFSNIFHVTVYLPRIKTDYECPDAPTNLDDDQVAKPRVFKVHATYEMLEKVEGQTHFIVPIRNPYDTEYSLMKFMWRLIGFDQDMSAEDYKKSRDSWPKPDFANFIASWYRHRNDPNVFIIPYEDLKYDLAACIQKLAVFITGEPLTEPTLSKVLHFCSFEYMSKNKEKFEAIKTNAPKRISNEIGSKKEVCCVRSDGGQVGQGQALLDESIKRLIDTKWADIIQSEFGFKSYDDLYKQCSLVQRTNEKLPANI